MRVTNVYTLRYADTKIESRIHPARALRMENHSRGRTPRQEASL